MSQGLLKWGVLGYQACMFCVPDTKLPGQSPGGGGVHVYLFCFALFVFYPALPTSGLRWIIDSSIRNAYKHNKIH